MCANNSLHTGHFQALFNEGYSLSDLLPYIEFKDDVFILCDGSLGKIWKVTMAEGEGKSQDALLSVVSQWEGLLNRIPNEHLACQMILKSDHDTDSRLKDYLDYTEEEVEHMEFAKGKDNHIRSSKQGFFMHQAERFVPKRLALYVTLRFFPIWEEFNILNKFSDVFGSHPGSRLQLDDQIKKHRSEFMKQTAVVEGFFHSIGVSFEILDGEDLVSWLYGYLNPLRSKDIPKVNFNEEEPIRDQILYHSPQANGTGFILEDLHTRVISLKELPTNTIEGMFSREFYEGNRFCLLDIPQDFMFVVNFSVQGSQEAIERLNMQKNFAFMHKDNWLGDQSVEAVEKKKDLDQTISSMFKSGGKIVNTRFHWIIQDESNDAVDSACNAVLSGLNRLNCQGLREELIGASLFLTCLPLNFDPYFERFIRRARQLTSGNAADMLPILGSLRATKTPAQMYCNRRGELVFLDFFDSNINPHGVVIGASGSGKSFFINDFILQNDRLGAHFFVLDKGDSYKKLCNILNGQYMDFNINNPMTINPFANPPTSENLSFLLSLLSQMASGGDERYRLNREEEGLIHRSVVKAYEHQKQDQEVTLSDVIAILNDNSFNEQFGINSLMGPTLALRLTPFTKKGPFGGFFDGPNQFTIDKRFVVFELANLSAYSDLQICVLLNLMFYMTNFVSAPTLKPKRKYLLIDEAWSLLKVKNTAEFITNAFKTFRKYRCSVVAITQEMEDLTRQESGIAIVANTSNKIFLKQEPSVIDLLKNKLSLDDGIIKALKTLETVKGKYSEGFVITDSCCGVIRLVPDPFLYWVANSEPRNNEFLIKKANACNGDLIKAIKICAKEHPYGV